MAEGWRVDEFPKMSSAISVCHWALSSTSVWMCCSKRSEAIVMEISAGPNRKLFMIRRWPLRRIACKWLQKNIVAIGPPGAIDPKAPAFDKSRLERRKLTLASPDRSPLTAQGSVIWLVESHYRNVSAAPSG